MTNRPYYIFFFILLVATTTSISAQTTTKDSIEIHSVWAKRAIIEATHAYMKDYKLQSGNKLAKEEIEGIKQYELRFMRNLEDPALSIDSLPEADIRSLLNEKSWNKTRQNIFDKLVIKYKDHKNDPPKDLNYLFDHFTDQEGNIIDIGSNWKEVQNRINASYIEAIEETLSIEPKKNEAEPITTVNYSSQAKTKDHGIARTIILLLLGIIIGAFLTLYLGRRFTRIVKRAHAQRRTISEFKDDNKPYQSATGVSQQSLQKKQSLESAPLVDEGRGTSSSNSQIKELQSRIRQLERENDELRVMYAKSPSVHAREDLNSEKALIHQSVETQALQCLYFSMPSPDGSFNISNGVSSSDGQKYYKISYSDKSDRGELTFVPSSNDKYAINRLSSVLEPVCKITNIENQSGASRIEVLSAGKVHLSNSQWKIDPTNKVSIRLV